jgi:DNA-binding beta-propeller fold protein YncE
VPSRLVLVPAPHPPKMEVNVVSRFAVVAFVVFCGPVYLKASSGTAYVSICCNAPSTVGVFNASTLSQSRNIVTGSGGDAIALSPDGERMFVTADNASELQVIETATGAILATVPVPLSISGGPPLELAISPDGSKVYVFAPQARPDSLLLAIDATTYQVTHTASIPNIASLGPLLVSPDGAKLYFEVGYANEYIQVVDAVTLALLKEIPVNEYPSDLAVTPTGLILMTDTNNQLLVIEPKSSAVKVLPLPNDNHGIPGVVISSPDSTTAYISFATGSILAVSIATGATVFDAGIGYSPTEFAISPDGASLYSTNLSRAGAWSLSEFHIPTRKPVMTVGQIGPISRLALTKDGHSLFVLNANNSAIASVDMASLKVTHVTHAGVDINSLAIPPRGTTVWASQYAFSLGGDTLFLDPATEQLKYVVNIFGGIAFSPNGTVAYTYNPGRLNAYDVASLTKIGSAFAGQLTNIDQAIPSPDGARLYMSVTYVSGAVNQGGTGVLAPGAIRVLDTSTFKYEATVSVSDGIGALGLTPDGSALVYTTNHGRLRLVSTATNKIIATVQLTPVNGLLNGLALSPDGSRAYVVDTQNNLLLVANLKTQTQQASFAVGSFPSPVAITPDGSEAWVATLAGLEVVNTTTGLVRAVALPGEPSAIVFAQ